MAIKKEELKNKKMSVKKNKAEEILRYEILDPRGIMTYENGRIKNLSRGSKISSFDIGTGKLFSDREVKGLLQSKRIKKL